MTSPAAENGGERVEMEFTLPPGSVSPPPHVYDGMTEEYEVIEGSFDGMVRGDWVTLRPGQSASVPPDTLHTFKNRSGRTVRVRNVHRPPARFENYIEHICKLTRARGIGGARDPRLPIYPSTPPPPEPAQSLAGEPGSRNWTTGVKKLR